MCTRKTSDEMLQVSHSSSVYNPSSLPHQGPSAKEKEEDSSKLSSTKLSGDEL